MVIEDVWQKTKTVRGKKKSLDQPAFPLAQPFDRFAAQIADLILFLPLVSVSLAFLRKQMLLAQLVGTEPEIHAYALFYFLAVVFLGTAYQFFFLVLVGATPGKFFFGMRVWDIWTKKRPHWQKALTRCLLWWVDLFLILPLFALFFDSHRRPFHDRLSDTVVVNQRNRLAGLPSKWEAGIARGFFSASLLTMTFILLSNTWMDYRKTGELGLMLKRWAGGTPYCEAIDKASEEWPKAPENEHERLLVAMALYASDDIDEDCLDYEADALIWLKGISKDTQASAYLAKAFSQMEEGDESNQYLEKVCAIAPDSDSCKVIGLIEHFQSEEVADEKVTRGILESVNYPYVKVWVLRYYYKTGQLDKLDEILADLEMNRPLARFLTEFRIKSFWRQGNHSAARSSFVQHWESSQGRDVASISWWLCDQQLIQSCDNAASSSCGVFKENFQAVKDLEGMYDIFADLTRFKKQECEMGDSSSAMQFIGHLGEPVPPELLTYVDQFQNSADSKEQLEDLLRIATHRQYSIKVRQDAALRALNLASNSKQLSELTQYILELDSFRWAWYVVTEKMYSQFVDWRAFKTAARLSDRMQKWVPSKKNLERQVYANYRAGKTKKAQKIYRRLTKQAVRAPASLRDKERVFRALRTNKFSKKTKVAAPPKKLPEKGESK